MSTRATIKYTDQYHLYQELTDVHPDDIHISFNGLDYKGDPTVDTVQIPWEAAVALAKHVQGVLQHFDNLKDPVWLLGEIVNMKAHIQKLTETPGSLNSWLIDVTQMHIKTYQGYLDTAIELQEAAENGS